MYVRMYACMHANVNTTQIRSFPLIRLLKNHFPFFRKVRNPVVDTPDFLIQILERSSGHGSSVECFLGFFTELFFALLGLFGGGAGGG